MPAAAVIPALKMHRTIAAVKKLVVGSAPAGESPLAGQHSVPPALGRSAARVLRAARPLPARLL